MGEKVFNLIESFATGENRRIFWFIVVSFMFVLLLTLPYFIATFFSLGRIASRIDNLSKLIEISNMPLESQPILQKEYLNILRDMEAAQSYSFMGNKGEAYLQFEKIIKYIGGCFIFYCLSPIALFDKSLNEKKTFVGYITGNIPVFLFCFFIGTVLGIVFMFIPTIGFAPINALITICLEFAALDYWANN